MRPTRLAALSLAIIFLAGALFGFVVHSYYSQRTARAAANPQEFRVRYITRLQKDLALSPEQLAQITAILDDTSQHFREIRERMEPEFEALRVAQRQRIMAVLTPEQQPKYQKILEEHRKKQREKAASANPSNPAIATPH
jgi:Spy/CpxP family protein refolding chaperone